jgi:hypothetical protein
MPEFIGESPKYDIVDGNVLCTWPNRPGICIPLRVFRLAYTRAGKVLDEYDARGEVVQIRGQGG